MKTCNSRLEIPTVKGGYFDCWKMIQNNLDDYNIFIIIGGRRLGKTYSVLKGLIQDRKQHIYVRRTDSDVQECLTVKRNPYRALNDFWNVKLVAQGKETQIAICNEDDEVEQYLGIASSVSTSGSVRGAFLEDMEYLIYDEFINLKPVNTLRKKEGNLFLDLYDTANNDRDTRGKPPLKAILLSNANTTDDGIIRVLKLGHIIYDMITNDIHYYGDKERKIYIALLPNDNEVTNRRKKSAIGKLVNGTSYGDMAMNNSFTDSYFGDIEKKVRYTEYYPMCAFEKVYFYRHKADGHIYASRRKMSCAHYSQLSLSQFKKDYGMIVGNQFESGRMRYQNYDVKLDVMNIV